MIEVDVDGRTPKRELRRDVVAKELVGLGRDGQRRLVDGEGFLRAVELVEQVGPQRQLVETEELIEERVPFSARSTASRASAYRPSDASSRASA